MSVDTASSDTVFSILNKGLKLETAEDVQTFVEEILAKEDLETVILSGNSFGVEAAQALAGALKNKNSIKVSHCKRWTRLARLTLLKRP